jgi:hypothetical protein
MSIIVTNHFATEFTNNINTVLGNINDWFRINLLPLYFQKTYYLQFVTKTVIKLTGTYAMRTNKLLILTVPNFLDFSLTVLYLGITILINYCLN